MLPSWGSHRFHTNIVYKKCDRCYSSIALEMNEFLLHIDTLCYCNVFLQWFRGCLLSIYQNRQKTITMWISPETAALWVNTRAGNLWAVNASSHVEAESSQRRHHNETVTGNCVFINTLWISQFVFEMETIPCEMICIPCGKMLAFVSKTKMTSSRWIELNFFFFFQAMKMSRLSGHDSESHNHFCFLFFSAATMLSTSKAWLWSMKQGLPFVSYAVQG